MGSEAEKKAGSGEVCCVAGTVSGLLRPMLEDTSLGESEAHD